ncbi:MAG: hypothetical protein H0W63_07775 [Gemmatimonadaceae bacterium]|nr:hypothetical protein [Gemmatimonadaceae bacterium]
MKSTRSILAALAGFSLALSACAPVKTAPGTYQTRTTLKVDNRAYLDMTIYVMRGAERVRLGQATGASSSTFTIPADMVQMLTPLRFVADPIGSSRAAISEELNVRAGDEVVMEIPPG